MPYLSKIALNPRRRAAVSLLANPHRLHAAVLGGLATQPVTERVLWRLESNTPHRAEILVLTENRPSWQHLVEQAGWPDADGGQPLIADYAPLLQRLAVGREFAFRLTANPVQTVQRPVKPSEEQLQRMKNADTLEKRRGFRVAHRTAAQQLTWLLTRTERHGFTIPATDTGTTIDLDASTAAEAPAGPAPAVSLIARDTLRFRKGKDGPRVTLSTATFQGRLRVTDPVALQATLLGGIGPAKGYGQGMLTLAPLLQEAPHG
ncbi:type I-E CRISPR-associated protein Cas6/Cse3/CasE [Streptomyces broussonetiae]|uniref:Type I-E CRISPR-associated protein Cas6/Cse3/CasE n=1 Tax=Streptomyces broussonetiae TaxID=2686304 RepID=A0A6I6MZZ6_9ACTN|nr:type I-E CRISPR-associated protein Cas6/Cse3/CasE [Streptomyces broussonetiae]QHA02065.1 type I-E CRISPR-associated protein Cas6/Cse3/CasE [Streptomyces broussonetiae]